MSESPVSAESLTRDPPTTFWGRFRHIGPSLILTATLVGSGELIITTSLGAELGFIALWIVVGSCLLKVAVQEALGRFVISSGETSLATLHRLPGPRFLAGWAVWIWLLVTLMTMAQLGGIVEVLGDSMVLALPKIGLSADVWAPIVCAVAVILLLSGRYGLVERASMLLVSLFSLSIIICGFLIQQTDYAVTGEQVLSGFTFELPESGGKALAVVAAVGLSATELIYYAYWCLEKGYARFVGPNEDSPEWERRAKGWIRVMQLDCYFAMVVYTTTTVAFYFLGAGILHARGEIPENNEVVEVLSSIYTETIGPDAFYAFIACAFMVLFSTIFVSIASTSRILPDCLEIFGLVTLKDTRTRYFWIRIFTVVLGLLYMSAALVPANPVLKIILGLAPLGLMLPLICYAALHVRYKRLDPRLRPSLVLDIWLWVSALLTVTLTIHAFVDLLVGGAHG